VKDDAVVGIAQEPLARGRRLEAARFAFHPEVGVETDGFGHQAHDRLRAMDVEVVEDEMPGGLRRAGGEERGEIVREVLLGAGRAEAIADLSGHDVEIGDEGGGAVADVFELAALGASRTHRLRGCGALQGLHAGHLVDVARLDPGACPQRGEAS